MRRGIMLLAGGAAACVLLIRGLAPIAIQRSLEGPLDDGRFQLELDDVDLELLRGGVVFEGLALRRTTRDQPSLRCERLHLRIAWSDLLERRVRVRAIEIDAPQLVVQRGPNGGIELLELLDERAEPGAPGGGAAPDGLADAKPGWSFAVDRLALEEGQLRFRDLSLAEPGRWSATLDELVVRRLSFQPGVYTEPGELQLEGELEGAPLSLSARFALAGHARSVDAELELSDLPLRKTQLYLEGAGWTGVQGRVDASLHYRLDAERDDVVGSLELRDLAIRTPGAAEPALAWHSLSLASLRADVRAREFSLGEVRLVGVKLRVDAGGRPVLPILPERAGDGDGSQAVSEAEAESAAWQIEIAKIRVEDSEIRVRPEGTSQADGDFAVALDARADDVRVRSDSTAPFPAHVELESDSGKASFDGRLGIAPLRSDGQLEWQGLDLPRLARALVPESLSAPLRSGQSRGRMQVDLGNGTRLAGELTLADLRFEEAGEPDTPPCGLGWRSLEVPVEELWLPWPGAAAASGSTPELRLRVGHVRLVDPEVAARRDPQAIGCPIWKGEASEAETPGHLAIEGERIDVEGGRVAFLDRAVTPFVEMELSDVTGFARGLRASPEPSVAELELRGAGAGAKRIELDGAWTPTKWKFDAMADRLNLPHLNPYTHRYTPFFARTGAASVSLTAKRKAERIDTDIDLVLHDLSLGSEKENAFRDRYGLPLPVAMALLRDVRGDIVLDLPMSRRADAKTKLDVGALVYGALRHALLNAMTAPLKVLGAVVTRGEEIEAFEPEPILFHPGRSALSDAGRQQLARLAEVLASHPLLATRLEPRLGEADLAALNARPAFHFDAVPRAASPEGEMAESAPETPEALAAARVASVVGRLLHRHGIGLDRMQVEIAPELPAGGAPRVELALVPLPAPQSAPVEELLEAETGGTPGAATPPPAAPSS